MDYYDLASRRSTAACQRSSVNLFVLSVSFSLTLTIVFFNRCMLETATSQRETRVGYQKQSKRKLLVNSIASARYTTRLRTETRRRNKRYPSRLRMNAGVRTWHKSSQILLNGRNIEDLARSVRDLDRARSMEREQQINDYGLEGFAMSLPQYQLPFPIANPNTNSISSVPLPNEWFASYPDHQYQSSINPKLWISSCKPGPFHIAIHSSESGLRQLIQPILSSMYTSQCRVPWPVRTHAASILISVHPMRKRRLVLPWALDNVVHRAAQPMMLRRQSSWMMNPQPLPEFSSFHFVAIQRGVRGAASSRNNRTRPQVSYPKSKKDFFFSDFFFISNDMTFVIPIYRSLPNRSTGPASHQRTSDLQG